MEVCIQRGRLVQRQGDSQSSSLGGRMAGKEAGRQRRQAERYCKAVGLEEGWQVKNQAGNNSRLEGTVKQ
jgi:hypothetical protein